MKLLSIIIPIYNNEKYIQDCIESCHQIGVSQEFYEIICVDDGSTDNSLIAMEWYLNKYTNIITISAKNGGVSYARNIGIRFASGKYIWFVDSDDLVANKAVSRVLEICKENIERVRLGVYRFDNELNQLEEKHNMEEDLLANVKIKNMYVMSNLFLRRVITDINPIVFDEGIQYGEDDLFDYYVRRKTTTEIEYPHVFYLYRSHRGSAVDFTSDAKIFSFIDSYIAGMKIVKKYYDSEMDNRVSYYPTQAFLMSHVDALMLNIAKLDRYQIRIKAKEVLGVNPFLKKKNLAVSKTIYFYNKLLHGIFYLTVVIPIICVIWKKCDRVLFKKLKKRHKKRIMGKE